MRNLVLVTAPTIEPVTLAEAKLHLRVDTNALSVDVSTAQSIAPASYGVSTVNGTGVSISGIQEVLVILEVGATVGGTVAAKIQDSSDNVTFTDWAGGAFAAISANTTQQIAYTGTQTYLRVQAAVATGATTFSASVLKRSGTYPDDTYISDLITIARMKVESDTRRALITQTWDLFMDAFPTSYPSAFQGPGYIGNYPLSWDAPRGNELTLPFAPLQSVTTVTYYDLNGILQTISSANYQVDISAEPGRVRPAYQSFWPIARPQYKSVNVRYVAGYGGTASLVPVPLKHAIKLLVSHLYDNREPVITGRAIKAIDVPLAYDDLIYQYKVQEVV